MIRFGIYAFTSLQRVKGLTTLSLIPPIPYGHSRRHQMNFVKVWTTSKKEATMTVTAITEGIQK